MTSPDVSSAPTKERSALTATGLTASVPIAVGVLYLLAQSYGCSAFAALLCAIFGTTLLLSVVAALA